jgi:hypothetical protein
VTQTWRAEVTREDGWWMILVPELDLTTQAESWNEVDYMARGVIAADQDLQMSAVGVELYVHADPETDQLLTEARVKAEEADRLRAEALAANQAAARRLHSDGWSYRLIARTMKLTHQRVEQLVKGTR